MRKKVGSFTMGYVKVQLFTGSTKDEGGCVGYFRPKDTSITIAEGLPLDVYKDTLLHEMIHAASEIFGLGISEIKVGVLATALTQAQITMRRTKEIK